MESSNGKNLKSKKFVVEKDGQIYTFYCGDQAFSKVEGVVFSARKLASMKHNPARIKHEGRVLWCAERYFADLINTVNSLPETRSAHRRRVKKHGTGKRLSVKDLKIVGGKV